MNKYFGSARMRGVLFILAMAVVLTVGFFGTAARAAIGDIWAVQNASGTDVVRVTSAGNLIVTGTVTSGGVSTTYIPAADNTSDLGSHAKRWKILHMAGAVFADGGVDRYGAGALAIGANTATSVVITPVTTHTGAVSTVGGIKMTETGNGRAGVATLNGSGWVTVANTSVGASTRIIVSGQSTTGAPFVKTRSAATSFSIYSTDASDSGVVYWELRDNN